MRPVHAELEFLDDASDHADCKVDEEELSPPARHGIPVGLTAAVSGCLHDRDYESQADGERDEEEVVDGGNTELPPCQGHRGYAGSKREHGGTVACLDGDG